MKFACTRWTAVLAWTLFAGLVGLIIKTIEQRFSLVGRIMARLLGVAWSIAAIFVIPIIVREQQSANPINALKRSGQIIMRTWGEGLIGYAGMGIANLLFLVCSLGLLGVALAVSATLSSFWIFGLAMVLWLVAICAWSYLTSVAGQVYKGALYLYAAEGTVPQPFDQEMLHNAWKFKKS